jgi:hypothetical protein
LAEEEPGADFLLRVFMAVSAFIEFLLEFYAIQLILTLLGELSRRRNLIDGKFIRINLEIFLEMLGKIFDQLLSLLLRHPEYFIV